jgi:hypothetical protein
MDEEKQLFYILQSPVMRNHRALLLLLLYVISLIS